MNLPEPRIGPYVRALSTGVNQLAPHGDFVPMVPALAHLRALDPVVSGDQLLPAEVHDDTGMPAFGWMQRAVSEQALAQQGADPSQQDIERASRLDPALSRRLAHRRALRVHVRGNELLPATRLACAVRRHDRNTEVTGAYDRLAPDGRWLRIRFVVRAGGKRREMGPFDITDDARLRVDPLLQHLLTRHFLTPLLLLREQLGAACHAQVVRLSRGWIGPFWFPGVRLPDSVPASLGRGLLLHLSHEVVAEDVHRESHLDPLLQPTDELPPEGQRIFRERRFAASANVTDDVVRFCDARGVRCPVIPIEGRSRPRAI